MKPLRLLVLATLAFGALLGMGSLERGRIGVGTVVAAGGCGVGFHRGPYGGCRPNYYGGGGYGYRGGVVYGRRVYGGRAVYRGRGVYRRGGVYGGRGFYGGGRGFRGGGRRR